MIVFYSIVTAHYSAHTSNTYNKWIKKCGLKKIKLSLFIYQCFVTVNAFITLKSTEQKRDWCRNISLTLYLSVVDYFPIAGQLTSLWSFRKASVKQKDKKTYWARAEMQKKLGKLLIWTWRCSVKAQCKQSR